MNKSEMALGLADALRQRASRRSVLLGGAGTLGVVLLDQGSLSLFPRHEDYAPFREYQEGYHYLSQEEQRQLLGRIGREYLDYDRGSFEDGDERLCDIRISLDTPSLLSLDVQTTKDPHISLPVFEIQHNDNDERMIAPVLQTGQRDRRSFLCGMMPEGEHVFTVYKTVTSDNTSPEDVTVRPYRPFGSTAYESLLASHPTFAMRHDTFQVYMNQDLSDDARRKALMNGLLFFQRGFLRANDSDELRYEIWNGFTGEKGGYGKDPLKLMQKTEKRDKNGKKIPGRVYDYDTGVIITFNDQGEITEIVHQHDNEKGKHQFTPPSLQSPYGISPFSEAYLFYKKFQIVPDHGLVDVGTSFYDQNSDGVTYITRFTSFEPEFFVSGEDPDLLRQEDERGERIISLRTNIEWINDRLQELNQYSGSFFRSSASSDEITKLTRTRIALEAELHRLYYLAP